VYANDNSSIIDALKRLNGKGRAVVCIDPDSITQDELDDMHRVGVRGVRVNLQTRSETFDGTSFTKLLRKYADRIRPLGWVLQLYISLEQIGLIAYDLAALGVPVVVDHLGAPRESAPGREQAGYTELIRLLQERKIWVKMSGIYRFANLPDVDVFACEILRTAPTQVVWASDWPHSGGVAKNLAGDRNKVQDYRKISIPDFIARCKDWCDHDELLIRSIWVDNPRRLWQYDD
jgi:predicted TIM-barrel fold metal-dependent hydrolase